MNEDANSPTMNRPSKNSAEPRSAGEPPLPPSSSPVERTRRRTGKIARLPDQHRQTINQMLRDGVPYADIINKLAEAGHQLNEDNLSRWHAGGYQEWLEEQTCLEDIRHKLDFTSKVVYSREAGMVTEASIRLALFRLYRLLIAFDPIDLTDELRTSPGLYTKILDSVCKLTSGALKHERYRVENQNRLF